MFSFLWQYRKRWPEGEHQALCLSLAWSEHCRRITMAAITSKIFLFEHSFSANKQFGFPVFKHKCLLAILLFYGFECTFRRNYKIIFITTSIKFSDALIQVIYVKNGKIKNFFSFILFTFFIIVDCW